MPKTVTMQDVIAAHEAEKEARRARDRAYRDQTDDRTDKFYAHADAYQRSVEVARQFNASQHAAAHTVREMLKSM